MCGTLTIGGSLCGSHRNCGLIEGAEELYGAADVESEGSRVVGDRQHERVEPVGKEVEPSACDETWRARLRGGRAMRVARYGESVSVERRGAEASVGGDG